MIVLHDLAAALPPLRDCLLAIVALVTAVSALLHRHHDRVAQATLDHVRKHLTNGEHKRDGL